MKWTIANEEKSMNFSGTFICFIQGENNDTIFQSRHSDSKYTEEQCEHETLLASKAPELLERLKESQRLLNYFLIGQRCNDDMQEIYSNLK